MLPPVDETVHSRIFKWKFLQSVFGQIKGVKHSLKVAAQLRWLNSSSMACASASHCGLSCVSIRAHSVHHTNGEHAGCALLSVTGQGRWFCLVSCPAASVSDSCFLYHRPLSLRLFSQLQKQVNICLGVPSQRGTKKSVCALLHCKPAGIFDQVRAKLDYLLWIR